MREDDERFLAMGDAVVEDLRELAGLSPDANVIDIGCGYGRVAHALVRAPDFHGRYLGIDILPRHIRWCVRNLKLRSGLLRRRTFRFELIDVRNERYNPNGTLSPDQIRLPVPSGSADVVLAVSLFTHMWPEHIRHYLTEVRRVLAPHGRAYTTFFLFEDEWRAHVAAGHGGATMPHRHTGFSRYKSAEDPLHMIGYQQSWVAESVAEAGLAIDHLELGHWCGRDAPRYQDVAVLRPLGA